MGKGGVVFKVYEGDKDQAPCTLPRNNNKGGVLASRFSVSVGVQVSSSGQ